MIANFFRDQNGNLAKLEAPQEKSHVIWIDVVNPTREERAVLEAENRIVLPYLNEMMQIEYSNRFYQEHDALFLSVNVIIKAAPYPETQVITFILMKDRVISLRYANPSPISVLIGKLSRRVLPVSDSFDVLILLLQQVVGSVANIVEMVGASTDLLSLNLVQTIDKEKTRHHSELLNRTLTEISKFENVLSKCYQSLSSLTFLVNFFERTNAPGFVGKSSRFDSVMRDVLGLIKHADYLTQKLEFELESTLGLLNIEQTYIIKIFTVLAMVFMPPTLIASIYGMNFRHMPELESAYGYPIAIVVMFLSSLLPYLFFKKRGWV